MLNYSSGSYPGSVVIHLPCAQQANENVEPEVPGRSIQKRRENVRFPRFSPPPIRLGYLLREKGRTRGVTERGEKRSRLMEKVRKQQENKQPGCSRRDAFALKCPKLRAHVFLLFLPFLARSSAKWTLRDTRGAVYKTSFKRRKRFAQAPPPIIIAPITRLSISTTRIR